MVKVEDAAVPLDLLPALSEMGFTRYGGGFVRFCFPRYLEREVALSRIAGFVADYADNYEDMSGLDLERSCSPMISDSGPELLPDIDQAKLRPQPRRQAPIVIRYVRRRPRRSPSLEQRVLSRRDSAQNANRTRTNTVVCQRRFKGDCGRVPS